MTSRRATSLEIKQPNSRLCFACGLENPVGLRLAFYNQGPGRVTSDTIVPSQFQGYPGRAHGGIVAAMLDEIVGRTVMTEDPENFMVTAKLEVRYRSPIPLDQPLHLEGSLVRRKGRFAWAHADVRLPDGSVGAEADAMLVDIESNLGDPAALGWRVVPDGDREP